MLNSSTSVPSTRSLRAHRFGEQITRILSEAIQAVEPGAAIRRFVHLERDRLIIDDQEYDLTTINRIFLAAIGKAAVPMAAALADIVGHKMRDGLVICKHLPEKPDHRFKILQGGHPVPDKNSLYAGKQLMEFVSGIKRNDLLICLISGGGSALVTLPVPEVTLAEMQAMTQTLLECGARIDEINTLRRHLDQIKGGGLAKAASPARVVSLILSDVVNSPLEAIASGPTAPDPSTLADANNIIQLYALHSKLPKGIVDILRAGIETPKPGDDLFDRVKNVVVGSNELAASAALDCAGKYGFKTISLGNAWQGEAREVARQLLDKIKNHHPEFKPMCIVAGGETTVTLAGNGKGGRNQELALAAVALMKVNRDWLLVTLATDGEDGPTDAAGAVVTQNTFSTAKALGLEPSVYLQNNNAYPFFEQLDDLLKTGPTGTNVNDLTFLFWFPTVGG